MLVHFTFHHEFRHIRQFNVSKIRNLTFVSRQNIIQYISTRTEFDADRIAAFGNEIYFQYEAEINSKQRNTYNAYFIWGFQA
jgi:hypothetical protein